MKRLRDAAQVFAMCVVIGAVAATVGTFLSVAIRHPPTVAQVREAANAVRELFTMCGEGR